MRYSSNRRRDPGGSRCSRRRFLGAIGMAAGAVVASTTWPGVLDAAPARQLHPEDQFGRLFEELPPFAPQSPQVEAALLELGRPGGLLDARDNLTAGPVALIVDPALSRANPNSPIHPAGATFVGQFMDHDMTFDTTSRLGAPSPPQHSTNVRTPAFDLDSVYGGGPAATPALYDPASFGRLKVESGGLFEDLPRTADNRAIVADPRNDENLIIAGLHAAVLLFHNRALDYVRAHGTTDPPEAFASARRLTIWHYQWMILREFLPLFIGQPMVDEILAHGRRYYRPRRGPYIPVEFQGGAYRFGHSMVRPSYRANLAGDSGKPFFGLIFDPAAIVRNPHDRADLSGGSRAPRRFVGWQTFFDFRDGEVKPNKLIDTRLSTPLFSLPPGAIVGSPQPTVLPQRTLLRHLTWKLPSGQRIAQHMGVAERLSRADLQELGPFGFDESTPLFYYVLKEAELIGRGLRLGPVGGRIVGEVIIGLLQTDPSSYLSVAPTWKPTVPAGAGAENFRMTDFLTFAGVDPAARHQ